VILNLISLYIFLTFNTKWFNSSWRWRFNRIISFFFNRFNWSYFRYWLLYRSITFFIWWNMSSCFMINTLLILTWSS